MHEQAVAVMCWCVRARPNVHKEVEHLSSQSAEALHTSS